jgi:putative addiction module component (TIGR02574 family)
MHGAKEIIQEAAALPIEERALVIDSLLRTLNSPDDDVDQQWIIEAKRRLAELRSGQIQAISGAAVFEKIKQRFGR